MALHPDLVAASALVPLLSLSGRQGFLVVDMPDVDEFVPTVELPESPVYLVEGLDRGDEMANWSPDEANPAIAAANRTPLTLTLDQQRHRPRWRGKQERTQGRLVLGRQSAYLVGLCVSRGSQVGRRCGLTRRTAGRS